MRDQHLIVWIVLDAMVEMKLLRELRPQRETPQRGCRPIIARAAAQRHFAARRAERQIDDIRGVRVGQQTRVDKFVDRHRQCAIAVVAKVFFAAFQRRANRWEKARQSGASENFAPKERIDHVDGLRAECCGS